MGGSSITYVVWINRGVDVGSIRSTVRMSLLITLLLIAIGLAGSVYSTFLENELYLAAFTELEVVGFFALLFLGLIPGSFPKNVDPEGIFYSGLGKEPYINKDAVYRPKMPSTHFALLIGGIIVFWLFSVVGFIALLPWYIYAITAGAFILGIVAFFSERGSAPKRS